MGFFPVSLQLAHRPCTVVGGGEVAYRKVGSLLACRAEVRVISQRLTAELNSLYQAGALTWLAREYRKGDLVGSFLVIAATDDEAVQAMIHTEAEQDNLLLNVADKPKWCNVILPAVVRRGDLTIAISTGGASPALASKIRRDLEAKIGVEYEALTQLLAALRPLILIRGGDHWTNRSHFLRLVESDLLAWISAGRWDLLRAYIREVIGGDEALACVEDVRQRFADLINRG